MPDDALYHGREQTLVKHLILRRYLERFAHIIGSRWPSITYVDAFAGPWNVRSSDLQDSSFAIALEELRKARETHSSRGHRLEIRCLFIEKDARAYSQLERWAAQVEDVEVKAIHGEFEQSVDKILRFVRRRGGTFPFIFIDPTGWTGFALDTITPLLRLDPGEVLINFMTKDIRRFLEDEQSQQSFIDLFGSPGFREAIAGLSGLDREDAAVREYLGQVKARGKFGYACSAIVLHPEIDRTHFHLLYLTRHPKGVEVFKEAERRAMPEMEQARAAAQRRREEQSEQLGLGFYAAEPPPQGRYYSGLLDRYTRQAKERVLELLEEQRIVPYDLAWVTALSQPLVWESDLKAWLDEWQSSGHLTIHGLDEGDRVPRRDRRHSLAWSGG